MDIFIADISALRLIRLIRTEACGLALRPTSITEVTKLTSHYLSIRRLGLAPLCSLLHVSETTPLCLLAPRKVDRRCPSNIKMSMRSLPRGPSPFLEVVSTGSDQLNPLIPPGMRVFVESPASLVLSMARKIEEMRRKRKLSHQEAALRLLKLCLELCGTYSLDPFGPLQGGACFFLAPVLSIDELTTCVCSVHKLLGLPLVREVMPLIFERSASPQESFVGCALFNPTEYGGFFFGAYATNKGLKLSDEEKRTLSFGTLTPDFFMAAYRIAIEYNGEYHERDDNPKRDRRRMNGYSALGYRAFIITRDEVRTLGEFNKVARQIAHAISMFDGEKMMRCFDELMRDKAFLKRQRVLFEVFRSHLG